jgi:uncharacterized protein YgiM (DUF1202 family)
MRSYINLFILAILISLVSVGFARGAATPRSGESVTVPGDPNEPGSPSFPYVAEITGDNVYIRSGAGTNFYRCGKLNKGDKVKVVSKQYSWSRIVPPAGSFSWISMEFVKIKADEPGFGEVTGDGVRVYAGSDTQPAMYSTSLQGKLDRGDKVKLLGEQMDGYYKISVPSLPGAFLWVSTSFTKPVPQAAEVPTAGESVPEPNDTTAAVPVKVPPKTKLEEYRALQKQVEAERAKPIDQQDYASLKKALIVIAGDKEADKAARYAQSVVKRIEGIELYLTVVKQSRLQNEQLTKIKAGIDKARVTKLATIQDLGRFAAVGILKPYETYGAGHFRIVDKSGKMICYALPGNKALQSGLSALIGKKVGIVGKIEPHLPTKKALVRFSEIVELK